MVYVGITAPDYLNIY